MIIDFIARNKTKILIIMIPLLIMFLLLGNLTILTILIIINIILGYFMGLWHMKAIGIEFVLLITVITGMLYGPTAGGVIGFILITIHMILSQHLNIYLLWVNPGYVLAGFLAGSAQLDITTFGIYATLGLNLFNLTITAILFKENVGKFLPFAITNVMFNVFIFLYIAPSIFSVMTS